MYAENLAKRKELKNMRQLQAKLSAGILTAVMILGMVFTMAPMKADAATYQDVLNVLAVDENGTPLANVELGWSWFSRRTE